LNSRPIPPGRVKREIKRTKNNNGQREGLFAAGKRTVGVEIDFFDRWTRGLLRWFHCENPRMLPTI